MEIPLPYEVIFFVRLSWNIKSTYSHFNDYMYDELRELSLTIGKCCPYLSYKWSRHFKTRQPGQQYVLIRYTYLPTSLQTSSCYLNFHCMNHSFLLHMASCNMEHFKIAVLLLYDIRSLRACFYFV